MRVARLAARELYTHVCQTHTGPGFQTHVSFPPDSALHKVGLTPTEGTVVAQDYDRGLPFDQIADRLERGDYDGATVSTQPTIQLEEAP